MKIKELAKASGIEPQSYTQFRGAVKALLAQGKLVRLKRGRIGLPDQMDLVTGIISLTKAGFGFVTCENSAEEIFVAARDLFTSFDGDRVMVRLKPGRGFKDKREGVVLKILERKTTRLVGKFKLGRGYAYVVPDSKNVHRDIYIGKGGAGRARDNDKVVVELEEWIDPHLYPEGKVVERLGPAGDPKTDTLCIIRKYELPTEFPEAVEQEAEAVAADWSAEESRRRDLTKLTLFTIDPIDARDFDDAVSIEMVDGHYRLGVHIADVSHFVRGGTKLDGEAFARGTSVYFPDQVIPMLPESLSNDACSLRPNRKRLAMTIFIDFDRSGNVLDHDICQSLIRSRSRLTYEEVQEFFDGATPGPGVERVARELLVMRELAQILLRRRQESGSLDFDLPEAKITLDNKGNVVDIGNRVRTESHRLVEEFMLAANREVALHFFRHAQPILYRVHDKPDLEKLEAFSHFVKAFGYSFPVSPNMPTRDFSVFLNKVKGKPEEDLLNELLLRSMKKAVYQPDNLGHFGLAFTHYLHFTSPIRRYPDLLVHRLLKQLKNGRYPVKLAQKLGAVLTNVGKQSSDMERRSMEAEREAVKAKQVAFMAEHIGWEYEGIVSGMLNFGFFVRMIEPGCEGLVRVSTLDDDYYTYDETGYRMVGRRRGRVFRLGDKVRVGIMKVDVEAKEIDLFLAKIVEPAKPPARGRKRRSAKK